MLMSQEDKLRIQRKGDFLIRKGYKVSTGQYDVEFDNGQVKICVFFERYDSHQDILIKFSNGKVYYLHFIFTIWNNSIS